ncbi:hypothetical protein FD724_36905 (plasmid) [Nostoc sp. C057]|uniref:hypothetical protein n=1 Tax=Nostoc sp. C057 TaxID=2576903 RepID=UPI0015C31854|nr:hypothetical protein [Nostoc sp. C057]QLE53486.1 hypothetical protein FD724_36905 [Nostoc sp. C057]
MDEKSNYISLSEAERNLAHFLATKFSLIEPGNKKELLICVTRTEYELQNIQEQLKNPKLTQEEKDKLSETAKRLKEASSFLKNLIDEIEKHQKDVRLTLDAMEDSNNVNNLIANMHRSLEEENIELKIDKDH